jgi:recombinational DNA repair protein RecR
MINKVLRVHPSDNLIVALQTLEKFEEVILGTEKYILASQITSYVQSGITALDASKIANGNVSNTEFQYLDGVTSAIQTQLNTKAEKSFAIAQAIALG